VVLLLVHRGGGGGRNHTGLGLILRALAKPGRLTLTLYGFYHHLPLYVQEEVPHMDCLLYIEGSG
jgi:hypothetical protein